LICVFVVSHGAMADGLVNAMEMIAGKQDQVIPLGLRESEAPEDLINHLQEKLEENDDGDGALIMVDLFGASPFNSSSRLYMESHHKIEVVTGVNLPMLLEIVFNREGSELSALADTACQIGKNSIQMLPESIRKQRSAKPQ